MTRPLRPTAPALALALLSVVSTARDASAQAAKAAERPSARDTGPFVASISPPSAVLGTSTEWTITGRNLAKVDRLVFSGSGLTVTNIRPQSDNQATATVLVADSAEPGFREVRAMGPHG